MLTAFFDIDHTIVCGTSMERVFLKYLFARRYISAMDILRTGIFIFSNLFDTTGIAIRSKRPYLQGKSVSLMKSVAEHCFKEKIVPLMSIKALAKIREHQKAGHRVVLLSGTLDILAQELTRFIKADHFIACTAIEKDGYFTGDIMPPVPYGDLKRDIVLRYAQEYAINLKECFAYGDSIADSGLFRIVGNPVVVNPARRLYGLAKERGWEMVTWIHHQ